MRAEHTDDEATPSRRVLVVLGMLAAAGPIFNDVYLPGLPGLAAEFGATPAQAQISLAAGFVGLAAGQLLLGPLSDRYGRRLPLVAGLLVGVAGATAAAAAPNLPLLVVARLVQGFGVAAGIVISRAMVADLTTSVRTLRWLSVISVFTGVAALAAPVVGGVLDGSGGWRLPLCVLALYLAVLACVAVLALAETRPSPQPTRRGSILGPSRRTVVSAAFLGPSLTLAFGFGAYMAFVSASPFVYQTLVGWTSTQYGFVFAAHASVMIASSLLTARAARRIPVRRLLGAGVAVIVLGSLATLLLAAMSAAPVLLPFALMLINIGVGAVLPTSTALALAASRSNAGLGSAVLGCLQFSVAAVMAPLVSLGDAPLLTFGLVLVTAAALAAVSYAIGLSDRL